MTYKMNRSYYVCTAIQLTQYNTKFYTAELQRKVHFKYVSM